MVVPLQSNLLALSEEKPEGVADVPVPVEVQTFESPFGKARAVIFSDGTPWFVAKDVCEGLGLDVKQKGVTQHLRRLDPEQKLTLRGTLISNQGVWDALFKNKQGAQAFVLITRGGYNRLLRESRKPVAREYCKWVDEVVLPALQDNGTFTNKNHPAQQQSLLSNLPGET